MRIHTPATALARLATIAALGLLVAGCGSAPAVAPGENESPSPTKPKTKLDIEISIDENAQSTPEGAKPRSWTLTCSPAGGDHPDPEAACADLKKARSDDAFAEIPKNQMCTHIYGGPEVATVTGNVGDSKIDTKFTKQNGCELDRYKKMGVVLAP